VEDVTIMRSFIMFTACQILLWLSHKGRDLKEIDRKRVDWTNGRVSWGWKCTFCVYKMLVTSWTAKSILASQEGSCSIPLISKLVGWLMSSVHSSWYIKSI
jgi:hypothetical protein